MIIALGSTSTDKMRILSTALDGILECNKIEGIAADSGIPDQPMSSEETTRGAINRAKNALASSPNADLAIGLEGGLEEVNGLLHLVCVAAIWDGSRVSLGSGALLPLPKSVSDKILKGGQFGDLIREYQTHSSPEEEAVITKLVSREESFVVAIQEAVDAYQHERSQKASPPRSS